MGPNVSIDIPSLKPVNSGRTPLRLVVIDAGVDGRVPATVTRPD